MKDSTSLTDISKKRMAVKISGEISHSGFNSSSAKTIAELTKRLLPNWLDGTSTKAMGDLAKGLSPSWLDSSSAKAMSELAKGLSPSWLEGSSAKAIAGLGKGLSPSWLDSSSAKAMSELAKGLSPSWLEGSSAKAIAGLGKGLSPSWLEGSSAKAIAGLGKGLSPSWLDNSSAKAMSELAKGLSSNWLDDSSTKAMSSLVGEISRNWNNEFLSKNLANVAAKSNALSEQLLFDEVLARSLSSIENHLNDYSVENITEASSLQISPDIGYSADEKVSDHDNTSAGLLDRFYALPPYIQPIVYWFCILVICGAITDYAKGVVLEGIHNSVSYLESLTHKKPVTRTSILTENADFSRESLNQFRLITGDNVRLRTTPSMKSNVIEMLDKNTVVAVLGREGRQWLFIQTISGNEKITGWVNRSYTKQIGK